ncbi:MAG: type II secretion system secretin GspD [Bacteriovoracia bacterium]
MFYLIRVLVFFISVSAFAQTGFNTPGTGKGVPFGGKPTQGDGLFDDDDFFDEEDFEDVADEALRQKLEQRIRERTGLTNPSGGSKKSDNSKSSVNFTDASSEVGASTIGGGANSKIIPGAQGNKCLKLDPETGYGPDVITNFDFPDADIVEIAKTLGRLTCLNFILDKDVKGRISVVSNAPITVGDAWRAFLTALDVNNYSLIPSGKYYRIARQRDAKDKQIKTYSGAFTPDNDMYITRVIPLKYINAEEVRRVFSNFMPPNTRIIAYEATNTLIITDTGSNIKRVTDMLSILDIEGHDEKLEVIRIRYASAQDIAKLIDQLVPSGHGGGPGGPPGVPRFRGASSFSSRRTKDGGIISNIIPDERTNSVIVSANLKGLDQVRELIKKLDTRITASQGGSKIHVVYLQFADAKKVAETLNALTATAGQKTTATVGGSAAPAQLFEGAIKISADEATNSLVITGTLSDFQTVSRVIAKLDVPRDQVYVEAVIMEMNLNKTFDWGASVINPVNGLGFVTNDDLASFLVSPFAVQGAVMGFKQGNTTSVNIPSSSGTTSVSVSNVMGLVKALQQNSNANILATPQILTLDNQQASIEISDNVPVPQTTAVQGAGIQQSFSTQKVALSLQIKPQINKISNFVKLEIKQKMEDINNQAVPKSLQGSAIATLSRASDTTVIVQDGDTVVLGGLVRDKVEEKETKVPLLGDIPILGWLFKSTTKVGAKQNLVVFITPQIIKQYHTVRKIVDRKIRERDKFIEKHGGTDPHQEFVKEMIKSMPPVSQLKDGARVESGTIDEQSAEEAEWEEQRPVVPYRPAPVVPSGPQTFFPQQAAPVPNGMQVAQPNAAPVVPAPTQQQMPKQPQAPSQPVQTNNTNEAQKTNSNNDEELPSQHMEPQTENKQ